jgi:cytochrome P450
LPVSGERTVDDIRVVPSDGLVVDAKAVDDSGPELLEYDIPAGPMIMLSQWAVHRSPTHWDDPAQFRPERWENPDPDRDRFAYFPFGGGPRHCIGKNLAKLEAQIILAMVAQEYELSYAGPDQLALRPTLTLHPQDGMEMVVSERD